MAGELSACVLISEWASGALIIAFSSSVLRSGELANCSLVLFAACWRSVLLPQDKMTPRK